MITAEGRVRGSPVFSRTGTRGHVDPVTESRTASSLEIVLRFSVKLRLLLPLYPLALGPILNICKQFRGNR